MTLIEAGGLLVIIAVALPFFGSVDYLAMPASDFMASVGLVIAGAAMIFFAFTGFEDIANMGEEIIEPEKNLPKALLIALAITTVLYFLVGIAAISVVPSDQLANSKAPMAEVANKAMPGLGGLLVLIALFSTTNTVLILSIGGARMIYGLAKDKKLPQFLARVHSTRKTPYGAIILVMLLAILFALIGEIGPVVSINNFAIFAMFFLVNASVIALRFREPNAERKFRVPFSIGKVPIIPLLGAASCIVMLWGINMDVQILHFVIPSWTIAGIAICTGIPIYYFYKGRNN
jgi:APA family basic amino acid/polyamine antiporter